VREYVFSRRLLGEKVVSCFVGVEIVRGFFGTEVSRGFFGVEIVRGFVDAEVSSGFWCDFARSMPARLDVELEYTVAVRCFPNGGKVLGKEFCVAVVLFKQVGDELIGELRRKGILGSRYYRHRLTLRLSLAIFRHYQGILNLFRVHRFEEKLLDGVLRR